MTTSYITKITNQVNNGFSLQFSDTKFDVRLAVTTDTSLTIAGTQALGASTTDTTNYIAIFKVQDGKTVYVANNATAASSVSTSFATTTSEQIKSGDCRSVKNGDVLHFYTPDAGGILVNVLLYAVS